MNRNLKHNILTGCGSGLVGSYLHLHTDLHILIISLCLCIPIIWDRIIAKGLK